MAYGSQASWLRTDLSPALTPNYLQYHTPATGNHQSDVTDRTSDVAQRRLSMQQSRHNTDPILQNANATFDALGNRQLSDLMQKIEQKLPNNTLIILPQLVQEIRSGLNSIEQKNFLIAAACIAKKQAKCSVTWAAKGAAAIGKSGTIYLAYNVEFKKCSLSSFIHPFHFLISSLRAHGEIGVVAIALTDEPTDPELALFNILSWNKDCTVQKSAEQKPVKVETLLNEAYAAQRFKLEFHGAEEIHQPAEIKSSDLPLFKAQGAALHSFSPITNINSGVALVHNNGRIYPGSYIELPRSLGTLGPLQGAIAAFLSEGNSFSDIREYIVAEREGRGAHQESEIVHIIKQIAPSDYEIRIVDF